MVGQAVGATGESPKDDYQDVTGNPAFCAGRRHQILFLFAITFENPYTSGQRVSLRSERSNLPNFGDCHGLTASQ
jgi:hypothetical protein